jgi:hypothetical protein
VQKLQQWQPYNASLSNIDYVTPDSNNMNIGLSFSGGMSEQDLSKMNMLDMRFSNLPLDYFNGVLPVPQFGSESVVNLQNNAASTGNDLHRWSSANGTNIPPSTPLNTNASAGDSGLTVSAGGELLKSCSDIPPEKLKPMFILLESGVT